MSAKVHTVESVRAASWWPKLLAVKDTRTYAQLADQFNVNVAMIRKALEQAGQQKKPMPRGRKPRSASPSAPPSRAAVPRARGRRGTAESKLAPHRALLGKVGDDDIAKRAGLSRGVVGNYRRALGIPAYEGFKWEKGKGPPRRKSKGRMTAVAKPKPVARAVATTNARRRAASNLAVAVTATAGPRQLELVTIGRDLAEVAARAQAALRERSGGPWTVTQLRVLGPALE